MRRTAMVIVGGMLVAGAAGAGAHSEHEHEAGAAAQASGSPAQQTLTGEVVDVFCYLSHGKDGLGTGHAGCAKKCIQSGLPVAIKAGDQLYLATMADHESANKALADYAGGQVTVHGHLMEQDGQHLVAITHVENAN